jgi:cellulose synthase/poly-beta-1,6-N-acetylglucosamine synthase-like glycosyltransferase
MVSELGFWCCLGAVLYVYIGYPACAFLLAQIMRRDVNKADIAPTVTVLIAAFNEEREIERTVANKLSQDYPADRLEVIVVSDGSTDRTDDIVKRLAEASGGRVRLLRQEPRQGKTQALNMAMAHVTSEIVVFSDANSIYALDAVRVLARNFADPSVGYVTGAMVYTNPTDAGVGEGSVKYMSYENLLRAVETRIGSIVGVDGGVDAVRTKLYVPMRADQLPDFVLPLNVVEQGKRVVFERRAVVYETALSDPGVEFRMRVRVALRALWALYDKRRLLDPLRQPLFAWQLLSHKVLRYLAFIPLFGLAVFGALVADRHWFYASLFALQLAGYAAAGVGHLLKRSGASPSVLLAPYYFAILNVACLVAFWKFLNGKKMVLWKPRAGA